jgi:transcriptional regulator with XRE-family HTH domain
MIEEIKKALGCKTDSELARKLQVDRNTVWRWKNNGFHPSTKRLILLLLEVNR